MTAHQRTILKSSSATRKANSANNTQFEPASENVKIATEYQFKNFAHRNKGHCLEFTSSASGGSRDTPRKTDFRIHIGVNDYAAILNAMGEVDQEATLLAAASVVGELSAKIREERDAALVQKTKNRMLLNIPRP